jgi:hypothetical protein
MTPYWSEGDARHEAARRHANAIDMACADGTSDDMGDETIPSKAAPAEADGADGMRWKDLPREEWDAADKRARELLHDSADVSRWAVDLGAENLDAHPHVVIRDENGVAVAAVQIAVPGLWGDRQAMDRVAALYRQIEHLVTGPRAGS